MKKKIVLLFFVLMVAKALPLYAASLGTLGFWESSSSQIGRWSNSPKIYLNSSIASSTFTASELTTYITYARNQWSSAGISTSTTTSSSNADITYHGVSLSQLMLLYDDVTSHTQGYTAYTSMSYEGDWNYYSGPKTGYILSKANVYLVFISGKTSNHYKHVSTHELGHAMGWFGHASGSNNVMSASSSSPILNLTDVDKRHLVPVYY